MPRARRVVSSFLLWHLTAVVLGSVPPPGRVPAIDPIRHPTDDRVAAFLTPPLDRAAADLVRLPPAIWDAGRPIFLVARLYLRLVGLGQQWNMFWSPPRQDQYMRVRYFVGSDVRGDRHPSWMASELVSPFPSQQDDQIRLVRSYWAKHRDKALFAALSAFLDKREARLVRRETQPSELPQDLTPIVRYFRRQFERDYLADGDRILRTELWFGVADIPKRGFRRTPEAVEARLRTLHAYYDGPIERHFQIPAYPPYHASERESDILWVLEYFEEE
jgi:hypothetical protein